VKIIILRICALVLICTNDSKPWIKKNIKDSIQDKETPGSMLNILIFHLEFISFASRKKLYLPCQVYAHFPMMVGMLRLLEQIPDEQKV